VAPGGEFDAVGVEVPAGGEVEGFGDDPFDVGEEAGGEAGVPGADGVDLLADGAHVCGRRRRSQPSGPRRRPPRRCM
jgi:hypothetical protein